MFDEPIMASRAANNRADDEYLTASNGKRNTIAIITKQTETESYKCEESRYIHTFSRSAWKFSFPFNVVEQQVFLFT